MNASGWRWWWRGATVTVARESRASGTCVDCKEIQEVLSEGDQPWDFFGRNDSKAETPVLWDLMRRVDSWEKTLMLGGIGGKRRRGRQGWDGWMASLTQWTWVWVNSGSWWWTGRPVVLRFMGSQRVGHDWTTDLVWSDRHRERNFENHYLCMKTYTRACWLWISCSVALVLSVTAISSYSET